VSSRNPFEAALAPDVGTMARGAAVNVGGALATTCLSFALTLLITHEIRAGAFGLYSIALATVLLAQVPATLGLDVGAVRFVALRASDGDESGAAADLHAALALAAAASVAIAMALYASAPWLAGTFFHKPQAASLIRVAALAVPALALTRVVVGAIQGLGLMRYSALVNPVRVAAQIAVAAPVLLLGYSAHGLTVAFVVTSWVTLAVAAWMLANALPSAVGRAHRHWRVRELLRFSLPQTFTTLLLNVILWTDTILLGRLRAAADVGVYAVVQRLLSPAQTISTSTGQMFAPRIATHDARGDRTTLGLMLKRVTYWNVSLAVPAFALPILLADPLLRLFGARYTAGATALIILAAAQLFNAATGPLGQVINMSGRPNITLANNASVATLNIIGCVILIPRYGITGAACSTAAALTLVNLIKLVQVRTIFGIDPFLGKTARALAAGAIAAGVVAPFALLVNWPGALVELIATTALFLPLYAALFWWTAAGDEERELIRWRAQPALR
jgi:O-antigen/teichoic acid export membrane protein